MLSANHLPFNCLTQENELKVKKQRQKRKGEFTSQSNVEQEMPKEINANETYKNVQECGEC